MKLIIEIPEEVVKAIQDGEDYRYDIHTAIAQGKPCDTSGDLISRENLKKAIYKRSYYIDDYEEAIKVINNAPTVESNISETYRVAYEQGFRHGKEKYERPQGEWIEHPHEQGANWGESMYECSICHEWTKTDSDFCPNCGADMRGKEE